MGLFCLTKLFVLESSDEKGQIIVAYISGTITFVQFVAILVYHLFTKFMSKTVIWKKIERKWRKVNKDNMIVCEENVFDGDQRVPPEPTTSEIDFPPRGEQPLSVEAGMKKEFEKKKEAEENEEEEQRMVRSPNLSMVDPEWAAMEAEFKEM